MPLLKRLTLKEETAGHQCDRCGKVNLSPNCDFATKHTFGYGSTLDEASVSFCLCDACLRDVVFREIPGACFHSMGIERSTTEVRTAIEAGRDPFMEGDGA